MEWHTYCGEHIRGCALWVVCGLTSVVSVPAKFGGCALKIIEVRFFSVRYFFEKRTIGYCQFTLHGCQFDDADLKLREKDDNSSRIF